MNEAKTISTLNNLIETCKDGEQGFLDCAEQVTDKGIKSKLEERAHRCAEGVRELQEQVKQLGEEPETSSSTTGTMHRGWVNFKAKITAQSDKSILEEVERGEDIALKSYRKALDADLPADIHKIVERQYKGVEQNYKEVREMRERATSPRSPR
ncbi:MAG: PA2169 family four-helix-bundle protein [Gammaproteobacteria bacterium]|nr:PA2169 family four-helix-bundle protein [Gammaproteobacteria bacterium]